MRIFVCIKKHWIERKREVELEGRGKGKGKEKLEVKLWQKVQREKIANALAPYLMDRLQLCVLVQPPLGLCNRFAIASHRQTRPVAGRSLQPHPGPIDLLYIPVFIVLLPQALQT